MNTIKIIGIYIILQCSICFSSQADWFYNAFDSHEPNELFITETGTGYERTASVVPNGLPNTANGQVSVYAELDTAEMNFGSFSTDTTLVNIYWEDIWVWSNYGGSSTGWDDIGLTTTWDTYAHAFDTIWYTDEAQAWTGMNCDLIGHSYLEGQLQMENKRTLTHTRGVWVQSDMSCYRTNTTNSTTPQWEIIPGVYNECSYYQGGMYSESINDSNINETSVKADIHHLQAVVSGSGDSYMYASKNGTVERSNVSASTIKVPTFLGLDPEDWSIWLYRDHIEKLRKEKLVHLGYDIEYFDETLTETEFHQFKRVGPAGVYYTLSHGNVDENENLLSIQYTDDGSGKSDGELHPYEIPDNRGDNLAYKFVFINACSSVDPPLSEGFADRFGKEFWDKTRHKSFIYFGWKEVMDIGTVTGYALRFFEKLNEGHTAIEALYQADVTATETKWDVIRYGDFHMDFKK